VSCVEKSDLNEVPNQTYFFFKYTKMQK